MSKDGPAAMLAEADKGAGGTATHESQAHLLERGTKTGWDIKGPPRVVKPPTAKLRAKQASLDPPAVKAVPVLSPQVQQALLSSGFACVPLPPLLRARLQQQQWPAQSVAATQVQAAAAAATGVAAAAEAKTQALLQGKQHTNVPAMPWESVLSRKPEQSSPLYVQGGPPTCQHPSPRAPGPFRPMLASLVPPRPSRAQHPDEAPEHQQTQHPVRPSVAPMVTANDRVVAGQTRDTAWATGEAAVQDHHSQGPPFRGLTRPKWPPQQKANYEKQEPCTTLVEAVDLDSLCVKPPEPVDMTKILNKVYEGMVPNVTDAVAPIAHMEVKWSEAELLKRLVKYIYKGVSYPDLNKMPWESACRQILEGMMQGFTAACNNAPWFLMIDLVPTLSQAAWTLLSEAGTPSRMPSRQDITTAMSREYHTYLEHLRLDKVLWEASSTCFSDYKVQTKIFHAIAKSRGKTLEDIMAVGRPLDDMQCIETFTQRWIENTANRAWSGLETPEKTLTESMMTKLFSKALTPRQYGVMLFSTVPSSLTGQMGPPPPNWAFISRAVRSVFSSWGVKLGPDPNYEYPNYPKEFPKEWDTVQKAAVPAVVSRSRSRRRRMKCRARSDSRSLSRSRSSSSRHKRGRRAGGRHRKEIMTSRSARYLAMHSRSRSRGRSSKPKRRRGADSRSGSHGSRSARRPGSPGRNAASAAAWLVDQLKHSCCKKEDIEQSETQGYDQLDAKADASPGTVQSAVRKAGNDYMQEPTSSPRRCSNAKAEHEASASERDADTDDDMVEALAAAVAPSGNHAECDLKAASDEKATFQDAAPQDSDSSLAARADDGSRASAWGVAEEDVSKNADEATSVSEHDSARPELCATTTAAKSAECNKQEFVKCAES